MLDCFAGSQSSPIAVQAGKREVPWPVPGRVVMPATICKTLGAFLTPTQACIDVVHIIAAGAVLDPLLKRDRSPDTLIECSIRLNRWNNQPTESAQRSGSTDFFLQQLWS